MEDHLKSFLAQCKVRSGEPFTHTTKGTGSLEGGWYSGSYYIDEDILEDFKTILCNGVREGILCTLTEKPEQYAPCRSDVDAKSKLENGDNRQYTEKTLRNFVRIYQEEIKKIVDPDAFEEKILWCLVLEKPAPRSENGIVKDGFHLHFPHFICEGWVQDTYLREKVVKRMVDEKVWKDVNYITPVTDLIDHSIANKPWMMYGSVNYKSAKSKPYMYNRWDKIPEKDRYGHAYNHNTEEMTIEEMFEDEMFQRKKSVRYYLPRFLSIRGYTEATPLISTVQQKKTAFATKKRRRQIQKKRSDVEVLQDIKFIQDGGIVDMLSNERAVHHDSWMDVGWTLFNIGQGCTEALEMWIDFSKRSPDYKDRGVERCEKEWNSMEIRGKTVASLLAMAKADSPQAYKEWKDTNVRLFLFKSLYEPKPNEHDVSMVVIKMYGDRFKCAGAKKDIWYEFRDHRWREMDDGLTLKNLLVDEVVPKYCEIRKEFNDQIGDIEFKMGTLEKDSDEAREMSVKYAELKSKHKRCSAIITALKTVAFHKKVIEMCKLKMHDPNFFKKIDENKMLLGCENGVLDLELEIFRDGRPDDYITFSTGLYYQDFNEEDEEVKELDEFLMKVYPNEKLRNYFLDFSASCMQGGNVNKRFVIATGFSDGAKSTMFTLLEMVFGIEVDGYFGKFPRELLVQSTGKNSSGSARPELAQVRGKRIMGCQEITDKENINEGFVKEVTGNDSFFVRTLFEKGSNIKPQFTLFMQCNTFRFPGQDEALWSRIRVLDHEAKFVKPQDLWKWEVADNLEDQLKQKRFKADPNFKEKLPDLAQVLLWKLFNRYKSYKRTGLVEPDEVLASTNKHQSSNDIYLQFIDEKIEKEKDEEKVKGAYLRLADVYSEFKEWFKLNHPSYKQNIGRNTMKSELNRRLGEIENPEVEVYGFGKQSRWWGYKWVKEDDDEKETTFVNQTEN